MGMPGVPAAILLLLLLAGSQALTGEAVWRRLSPHADAGRVARTSGLVEHCARVGGVAAVFWLWAAWNTVTAHFDLGIVSFALAAVGALHGARRRSREDRGGPARARARVSDRGARTPRAVRAHLRARARGLAFAPRRARARSRSRSGIGVAVYAADDSSSAGLLSAETHRVVAPATCGAVVANYCLGALVVSAFTLRCSFALAAAVWAFAAMQGRVLASELSRRSYALLPTI